jgi:RNAse (barnase) inhibitor barstar
VHPASTHANPELMGLFRKEPSAPPRAAPPPIERLDVKLLESSAVTLYHKASVLTQDVACLQQFGYRLYTLDAGLWKSAADFHAAARRELGFPDYYVANLSSWIDCLGELDVPYDGGVVMQFRHFDAFARSDPTFAHTLLDSIESASRRFLLLGQRLLALVQSDDPRIRFERIGAVPVNWNPREWLDSDRGLRPAS